MAMIRTARMLLHHLFAVLPLITGTPFAAAQTSDANPVSVPDPAVLTADWWAYFQSAGDSQEARVEALQSRLDALTASISGVGARENRTRGLIVEVSDLAERYLDVLSREPRPPPPTLPAAETYSVESFLALAGTVREATFDYDLEREDVDRTARILAISARRINDAKAAYLALPSAAPERLERGLQLMRGRFLQSINEADLRLRRVALDRASARVERLKAELDRAAGALRVEPQEAGQWANRAQRAREDGQRLESEAFNARLRAGSFGNEAQDRARRRRFEQQIVQFEARIVSAQLNALEADIAAALLEHLADPTPATLSMLHNQRKALDGELGQLEENLEVWRRATDRERAAAMAELAEIGAADSTMAELHRSRVARTDETSQELNNLARLLAQGRTLSDVATVYIVQGSGIAADLLSRAQDLLKGGWSLLRMLTSESLFSINETPVTAGGLVRMAIILVVAWWVSRLLRRGLAQLMEGRASMSRASLYTLGRLSHYVILVVGFMIALSSIGIDFTKFALFASALGVGIGFGLQAIFSNFVAGLIILFEKSLKVGDFVELESGLTGEVLEINIRATLIATNDNIDILVPNSEFVSGRVTNWTLREAHRRLRIPFGVAYGVDKEKVKQAVLEAAATVPYTLRSVKNREPQVWLMAFGDSSLNFELVVWLTQDAVKRPGTVQAAYTWAIETALAKYGIEIPFPQRDLHIRSYLGHKDIDSLRVAGELPEQVPHATRVPGD